MIEYAPETGSTNADLAVRLRNGRAVREGEWLVADRQTAGRGRQGRTWFDGTGNFMGSTVVRLRAGDPPPGSLALVARLAVLAAIEDVVPAPFDRPRTETAGLIDPAASGRGSNPRRRSGLLLKWPNDLLIDEAKLAGILLEREGDTVIVGVGVNLAAAPELPHRRTVSLQALGAQVSRDRFAEALAESFARDLDRWRSYGLDSIVRRWLSAGHPEGTPLTVGEPGAAPLQGTFAGLAADGSLQLRLPDGTTQVIHSGEVHLARS